MMPADKWERCMDEMHRRWAREERERQHWERPIAYKHGSPGTPVRLSPRRIASKTGRR